MKTWYCGNCTWTGKSPDTVVQMWHRCREDRVRRPLWILDEDWTPHTPAQKVRDEMVAELFKDTKPPAPADIDKPRRPT